jgi:hypothetical protein
MEPKKRGISSISEVNIWHQKALLGKQRISITRLEELYTE